MDSSASKGQDDEQRSLVSIIEGLKYNARMHNLKFLVIDDDARIIDLMKNLFGRTDYTACFASTGSEGLSLFTHEKPDIVFIDIMLPDINGLEILEKIRQFKPSTLCVTITGIAEREELLAKASNLGAVTCLVKPFGAFYFYNMLDLIVQKYLSERKHRSVSPSVKRSVKFLRRFFISSKVKFWTTLLLTSIIVALFISYWPVK